MYGCPVMSTQLYTSTIHHLPAPTKLVETRASVSHCPCNCSRVSRWLQPRGMVSSLPDLHDTFDCVPTTASGGPPRRLNTTRQRSNTYTSTSTSSPESFSSDMAGAENIRAFLLERRREELVLWLALAHHPILFRGQTKDSLIQMLMEYPEAIPEEIRFPESDSNTTPRGPVQHSPMSPANRHLPKFGPASAPRQGLLGEYPWPRVWRTAYI